MVNDDNRAQGKRLAYLEGKKIMTLSQYAKSRKLSRSNFINKANRQIIEAFLEKGIWKIGLQKRGDPEGEGQKL